MRGCVLIGNPHQSQLQAWDAGFKADLQRAFLCDSVKQRHIHSFTADRRSQVCRFPLARTVCAHCHAGLVAAMLDRARGPLLSLQEVLQVAGQPETVAELGLRAEPPGQRSSHSILRPCWGLTSFPPGQAALCPATRFFVPRKKYDPLLEPLRIDTAKPARLRGEWGQQSLVTLHPSEPEEVCVVFLTFRTRL